MTDKFFNLFNQNQSIVTNCPVCHERYNPLEMKILEQRVETNLIHIKCRHCNANVLAVVTANGIGVTSIGLITDLNEDEVLKFKDSQAIGCDEIIEAHKFLSKEKVLTDNFLN